MTNIVRLNQLPDGSGNLTNDDIFVFMDDPSGSGITKKISLSEIASAVGGGGGNPFDQTLNTTDFPSFSGVSLSNLQFSDDSVQNTAYSPYTDIYELNSVGGDVYIDWSPSKQIQKLSLDGTTTNFLLGTGWPATNQSVDVVLDISVSNTTSITWAIADSWYNGDPITSLSPGKHQFLLRSMGPTLNISSSYPNYSYDMLSKQWIMNNSYIQSSSSSIEDDGINMNIYYIGSSS